MSCVWAWKCGFCCQHFQWKPPEQSKNPFFHLQIVWLERVLSESRPTSRSPMTQPDLTPCTTQNPRRVSSLNLSNLRRQRADKIIWSCHTNWEILRLRLVPDRRGITSYKMKLFYSWRVQLCIDIPYTKRVLNNNKYTGLKKVSLLFVSSYIRGKNQWSSSCHESFSILYVISWSLGATYIPFYFIYSDLHGYV